MKIRLATEADSQAWDRYVRNHPQGTVFYLFSWKRVITKTFGHKNFYFLAQGPGKEIRGILPLFEIKSLLFGQSLISVPFAELGGILATDEQVQQALLDQGTRLVRDRGAEYLELRNQEALPGLPTKDLYFNFKREILPEPEENLQAIPRKSRRMVRVGIKKGLQAEFGHHLLDIFYDLLAMNYHRLGTPIFPKLLFLNFLREFKEKVDILIVRTDSGHPVAGVLSFYFKDQVIPYYAGSDFTFRNLAPNDFMYWKLMEKGCLDGYKWFDFGRSKVDTGSFSFKKHWGFEPRPLAYQYVLHKAREIPNISPANPKYQKKIEIWRRLPLRVTRVIGPFIAKYLA